MDVDGGVAAARGESPRPLQPLAVREYLDLVVERQCRQVIEQELVEVRRPFHERGGVEGRPPLLDEPVEVGVGMAPRVGAAPAITLARRL